MILEGRVNSASMNGEDEIRLSVTFANPEEGSEDNGNFNLRIPASEAKAMGFYVGAKVQVDINVTAV